MGTSQEMELLTSLNSKEQLEILTWYVKWLG